MKNNLPTDDDNIDLQRILQTVWNGKIKIVLITFISLVIFSIIHFSKPKEPDLFESSLVLKTPKYSEFDKFIPIYKMIYGITDDILLFQSNQLNQLDHKLILDKFVEELLDYEELISILKETKTAEESTSKLPESEQQQKLFDFAKLFTVQKHPNKTQYNIKFIWHDDKEAREIIDKTLALTLKNFQDLVFKETEDLISLKRFVLINTDLKRLEHLREQSIIAKELKIDNMQLDFINTLRRNFSFDVNNIDAEYYLRGYRAIDKEILLIKNRKYLEYSNIEKKINALKKVKIRWIEYNIYLLNSKLLTKERRSTELTLALSIILGLIIGVFYVIFTKELMPLITIRKKETN